MDTALDEDDVDAALAAAEERVARLKELKAARERARAAGAAAHPHRRHAAMMPAVAAMVATKSRPKARAPASGGKWRR